MGKGCVCLQGHLVSWYRELARKWRLAELLVLLYWLHGSQVCGYCVDRARFEIAEDLLATVVLVLPGTFEGLIDMLIRLLLPQSWFQGGAA